MGVFTRAQLLTSGLTTSTIDRRAKSGALHRVLPSVYSTDIPDYAIRCRALIAWKPDAVLSHDTAAFWWQMLDEPTDVHATVPHGTVVTHVDGFRLHRRTVPRNNYLGEFPIVSREQCVIDLATTLDTPRYEAFIDAALSMKVSSRAVADLCDRSPGMHGVAVVREQLRRACPGTLSEPERILARTLKARNFHMEINAWVGPFMCDLVDYKAKVVVEVDGREFNSSAGVFTSDRKRQNELALDGWLVLRYSAVTVMANPDAVADQIIDVVRARRKSRG